MNAVVLLVGAVVAVAGAAAQPRLTSPTEIYKALQGPESERKSAFSSLGFKGDLPVNSINLSALQMDRDEELEQVLEVDTSLSRLIRVYDSINRSWQEVGQVDVMPPAGVMELAFREVVERGAKDLVLTTAGGGCGGGYCATGLSVWHLHKGRLVEVFGTNGSVSTMCFQESSPVILPDPERSERGYLIVRTSREAMAPLPPVCGKPERPTRTCTAYRWDAGKVRFVADPANTTRRCREGLTLP